MVKKLFKYEFSAYLRIMLPMHLILVALAFFGRMLQFFETDSVFYDLGFGSTVAIFVLAIIALFLITQIFSVVRFYKNMYTGEGYLSFMLPVTASQHIWAKVSTAVLVQAVNLLIVALSVLLFTAGHVFVEIIEGIQNVVSEMYNVFGAHLSIYAIEVVVVFVLSAFSMNLLFYSCISLGQTFRKNRVFAAVGMYFAYCAIVRFIEMAFNMLLFIVIGYEWFERIMDFVIEHAYATMHMLFGFGILIGLLMCFIFFVVTRYVMNKKLNLE